MDFINSVKDFELAYFENKHIKCLITNYGAKLIKLEIKQLDGQWVDVISGYDSAMEYINGSAYFGAICGRYCNRINQGTFQLNNKHYFLEKNYRGHHLHGGSLGIYSKMWSFSKQNENQVSLELKLPDGEMGYPGNLLLKIEFELMDNNLILKYTGISDQDTILNLAPHYYFNLNGYGSILNHKLYINSESITQVNQEGIPTGLLVPIYNTVLDFSTSKRIGQDLDLSNEFLRDSKGYDQNYVLRSDRNLTDPVATLIADQSNCLMNIYTSQPGLQLYTCNWDSKTEIGKQGQVYKEYSFVCLESQHFPDSPNHANFPSTTLAKGDLYSHFTRYEFKFVNGN